ncbi:probable mitochondrial saccharopine dehydrogenase-like oxidoreductase At5g39410 isoform X2 [Arachis ipaensis]|uniref:probable mitochondrial saccharopine dehydrogenase-like oxidoreductase At5g39410 isoform X2 n=1 Tax=Arachis ipaensis TaxID=130454 RepID=UPI000A2B4B5E|nr:probable mitochondrial saccharopine dehydrogenase-like oxidoreductase At5g39410 isoform X2 [Arachis ipaensis]
MASSSSTPMPQNPQLFDLVILGASGFTGKHVLKQALKFLKAPSSPLRSIALAGRSPSNLSRAIQWASRPNSPPTDIPLLTADTSDPDSLRAVCSRTRLLLNCVGPFRRHGDPVVAACAASGCDYLDITGEPEFMERMEARYHESAVESGSLVVCACGFDSVPAELGVLFNSVQWVGESSPYRVVGYLTAESERRIVGNFGTFESAVLAVESVKDLEDLRRSTPARTRPAIPGPPPKGALIEHQKKIGLWGVVLPSADSTLVGRTFSTLTENPYGLPGRNETAEMVEKRKAFWSSVKPTHFEVKLGSKHLLSIFVYIIIGIFIGLLGKTSFGRWLLLKYPSVFTFGGFSKNGPSEEEVESASFKMWFVGHGYSKKNVATERNRKPDMEIITRVMGPEMGYVTTPIILIQCALVLLSQRDNLPKGGVYTPGIVFGATDLRDRLQQNGLSFDVITKSKLSS